MNSQFGEIFMFLTNLAWKSRVTIPVLITTVFLVMDIRLQIEFNIQSGQLAAAEHELDSDDEDDDDDDNHRLYDVMEYTTDESNDDEEDIDLFYCEDSDDNEIFYCEIEHGPVVEDGVNDDGEYGNTTNRIRHTLGLS